MECKCGCKLTNRCVGFKDNDGKWWTICPECGEHCIGEEEDEE